MNIFGKIFNKIYDSLCTVEIRSGGGEFASKLGNTGLFGKKFRDEDINQRSLFGEDSAYFTYDFLMSLDKKDYPGCLSAAYKAKTGKKLNLRHPKTLNEKIQWLKIYDNLPIKSVLTDKVLVRDYIKDKIGEEYLKPVLWIGKSFDEIPFDSLPESFIIKANNGCKWHYIIKNKKKYLNSKTLFNFTRTQLNGWMTQSFFGYSDFETQYLNIKPQIIVEQLLRDDINTAGSEFWVYCVNSAAYTENEEKKFRKEAMQLSEILSKGFKFVRVDWMVYNNKLYFGEMTFTPFSGFFEDVVYRQDFYQEISKNLKIKN